MAPPSELDFSCMEVCLQVRSDDTASDCRTPGLKRAIAEAGDEMSPTIGLPDEIEPGKFTFTFTLCPR